MDKENSGYNVSGRPYVKVQNGRILLDPGPIVRETGLPGVRLDFNCGVRLEIPEGNWHVRITDQDTMAVLLDADVSGQSVGTGKFFYINYLVELWKDGEKLLTHHMNLAGKNVRFLFPIGVLGDTVSFIPAVEEFRRKLGCRPYCIVAKVHTEFLAAAYPEIVFLPEEMEVPECYASYYLWTSTDKNDLPFDYRQTGFARCIPLMLGLGDREFRPVFKPCPERLIREPYVCIAVKASAHRKLWNNPKGWDITVDYLKSLGYRVLCIDRNRVEKRGDFEIGIPPGAEDFTGDLPIQQRIDLLGHADFFVGLSSGLSWLAWGCGIPVVMISGFTLPFAEFYNPYRVINYHACNGCGNDNSLEERSPDYHYCARHGGTDRAFECTRYISPGYVCKTIDRLMADHGLPRLKE
ncbi:MAG: autotransporter strand-loop-strand O-heptosyltransferase [Lachnospiraceae bacterium]|nr:autotransporter strand-loop-strand O-heptosyltransferase [Lachnospiraceae bacterium]